MTVENCEIILDLVCASYGITPQKIMVGRSRSKCQAEPRMVACYLMRKIEAAGYLTIAGVMKRDHTTAINAFRKISERLYDDDELYNRVRLIECQMERIKNRQMAAAPKKKPPFDFHEDNIDARL